MQLGLHIPLLLFELALPAFKPKFKLLAKPLQLPLSFLQLSRILRLHLSEPRLIPVNCLSQLLLEVFAFGLLELQLLLEKHRALLRFNS